MLSYGIRKSKFYVALAVTAYGFTFMHQLHISKKKVLKSNWSNGYILGPKGNDNICFSLA